MKKLIPILLLTVLILTGCGSKNAASSPDTFTFKDSLDNEVTVKLKPENVAVIFPSYCDIWQLAGGNISISAEDAIKRGFVAKEDVQVVAKGTGKDVNTELLLASKPDFVILSSDYPSHVDLANVLRENNIPVALFKVDSFDQYLDMFKICTDIMENEEAFKTYGTDVQTQIDSILKKVSEIKDSNSILLIRAFSNGAKAQVQDNFVGQMLKDLNTENIANNADILLKELSLEAIVKEDPEYIFVTTMGENTKAAVDYMDNEFKTNPIWNNLSAIKEDKYFILPKELFHYKPNARWGDAYEYLAKILYPSQFN